MKSFGPFSFRLIILFGLLIFALSAFPLWAVERPKDLRGETFSDPSQEFPMSEEWIRKSIEYDEEGKGADLVVVMNQDIYYAFLPVIQRFGKENNLKIVVKEGSCGIASRMVANKTVDMGSFCCPSGKDDRLPGLKFHTMGIIAKAFFVHPENPVDNISSAQLRAIYRGSILRWSELKTPTGKPGPNWRIKTVMRLHCPKRPGHWHQLLDRDSDFSPLGSNVGSIPDMIAQVAISREAIGWESMIMVEKNEKMGKVKPIRIDGFLPTDSAALASLKYPFYRTYNLTTWEGKGVESKHAQKLAHYLIKEFERFDADKFGFVPASRLKKAGWKFKGNELVGEPQ